jgi:hypothetical protein
MMAAVRRILLAIACGTLFTAQLECWLFFFSANQGSSVAFYLLLPGIWLVLNLLGPLVATSDSGMSNLILAVVVGSIPNIALYSSAIFWLGKLNRNSKKKPADQADLRL